MIGKADFESNHSVILLGMPVLKLRKSALLGSTALQNGGLITNRLSPEPIPTGGMSDGLLAILKEYRNAEIQSEVPKTAA